MSTQAEERRLETTIDGITAWASNWQPQEDGSALCWIFRDDPGPFHQPPHVTFWPADENGPHLTRLRCLGMTLAENEVGIELLKEAKQLAIGEATVPAVDPGGVL